jgi:hypothetical protein
MRRSTAVLGLFLLACLGGATQAHAGAWEVTPFYGYRVGGDFNKIPSSEITDIDIRDSASYGLTLGYAFNDNFELEGLWSRQDTTMRVSFQTEPSEDHDITVEYFHVGGLLLSGDNLDTKRGFFSFSAGVVSFNPDMFSSETYFSWSIGGGGKFYFNDYVGLRLQGRFFPTYINSNSSGGWCSVYGCYSTYNSNWLTQTEFTVGLIFRFGY